MIESSLQPKLCQNGLEKKQIIFSSIDFEEELRKTIKSDSYFFCSSKHSSSVLEDKRFKECSGCLRDYCEYCDTLCHQNIKCKEKVGEIEIENNFVYEFLASCHCTHNSEKKSNSEKHIMCFYIKFLSTHYNLGNDFPESTSDFLCGYCKDNCDSSDLRTGHGFHNEKFYCKCIDPRHMKLHLLEFLKIFRTAYDTNNKKINYNQIKFQLKEELNTHFKDVFDIKKKNDLIHYHINIFIIDNIMFNYNFEISQKEELEFYKSIVLILQNRDKLFFSREKINMPLTFIFYFYQKYFFSDLQMITPENINILSLQKRKTIMDHNTDKINKLRESGFSVFSFENMKDQLFEWLLKLKTFSIRVIGEEESIPFAIYFLKLVFQSYCLSEDEIYKLIKLLFSSKYHKYSEEYNYNIRRYIDELLYISQICLIDILIKDKEKNHREGNFDYDLKGYYNLDKLRDRFYYYNNNDDLTKSKTFSEYLKKMFSNLNTFSSITSDYKFLTRGIKPNWVRYFSQEKLFFFECFHHEFLEKIYDEYFLCSPLEQKLKIAIDDNNYSLDSQYPKTKFILFQNMTIEWIKGDQDQINNFENYLNEILEKLGLLLDLNSVENQTEFVNYLFYSFYQSTKHIQNVENTSFSNFKIEVSKFLKEKKVIQTSDIKLRPFLHQLKFIFYKLFVLEFYKDKRFKNYLNKWNLLLFCFFCNLDNAVFIYTEIHFLDFLLNLKPKQKNVRRKKSYLTTSLYNHFENLREEKNFTWKCFYISFSIYIDRFNEFKFQKKIILKKFVYFIVKSYLEVCIFKDSIMKLYENMNNPLIYYFLKITKKLVLLNSLEACFPYNFDLNKFDVLEKINVFAKILSTKEWNFKKLFPELDNRVDDLEGNIIKEKHSDDGGYELNIQKFEISMINRKIELESNQLLIFDILGDLNTTTDLDIYFKILNENLFYFEEFLTKKQEDRIKYNDRLKSGFYLSEIIILKFILNFINIKFFNFSQMDIIIDTDITIKELDSFWLGRKKKNMVIENKIDLINSPINSKYMVSKMKVKVLKVIDNYLQNFDESFYDENTNRRIGLYLLNTLSIILKDYEMKSKENLIVEELQEELFNVLKSFKSKINLMLKSENLESIHKHENQNLLDSEVYIEDSYEFHQIWILSLSNKIEIKQNDIDNQLKISNRFFGTDSNMCNYLLKFVEFEKKKLSPYSVIISDFLKGKQSEPVSQKSSNTNNDNFNSNNNYFDETIGLKESSESIRDKDDTKDDSKLNFNNLKNENREAFCFDIWSNLNKGFCSDNKENLNDIIKYLFKDSLKMIEKFNETVSKLDFNFQIIFNEKLLRIIYFLNHLLYYYNTNFQENIMDHLDEKSVKIFLRNIIKLNNYIIGISEYESNVNLMSVSKVYFILMDFFILLSEGLKYCKLEEYFYLDLNDDPKDSFQNGLEEEEKEKEKEDKIKNIIIEERLLKDDIFKLQAKKFTNNESFIKDNNQKLSYIEDSEINVPNSKYDENKLEDINLEFKDDDDEESNSDKNSNNNQEFVCSKRKNFQQKKIAKLNLKSSQNKSQDYIDDSTLGEKTIGKKTDKSMIKDNSISDGAAVSNKGNFFYLSFLQMRNIINLINRSKSNNFSCGSNRLILQFLYLSRFLRESLEVKTKNKKEEITPIIKKCFAEIFELTWITSEGIKKNDYSFILRYELVNLLVQFLEENPDSTEEIILKNFHKNGDNPDKIILEILKCFETLFKDYLKVNIEEKSKVNNNYILNKYIENDEIIIKNNYFNLAEIYYKLSRKLISVENNITYRIHLYSIIEREKFNDQFFFLISMITKEIEVKFPENTGKFIYKKIFFFKTPKCFLMDHKMTDKFAGKAPRNILANKLHFFNKRLDKFLFIMCTNYSYYNSISKNKFISYFLNWHFSYSRISSFCAKVCRAYLYIFVVIINFQLVYYCYNDGVGKFFKNDLNSQIFFDHNSCLIEIRREFSIVAIFVAFFFYLLTFLNKIKKFEKKKMLSSYRILYDDRDYFIDKDANHYLKDPFTAYSNFRENFQVWKIEIKRKLFLLLLFKKNFNSFFRIFVWSPDIFPFFFILFCNILFFLTESIFFLVIQIFIVFPFIDIYGVFHHIYRAIINQLYKFLFMLIFIYIVEYTFSWMSFLYFQEYMISEYKEITDNINGDLDTELLCSTPLECFLNYIHLGLRLGGGMADSSMRLSFKSNNKSRYFAKLIWDILSHIIINIMLANIFIGLIVDAFNELRNEEKEKIADLRFKCYLCNKDVLNDKKKDFGFGYHIYVEHNMFNYLFFIPYLLKKNPQEFSRPEYYAWEQINTRKLDWYPSPVDEQKEDEDQE